MFYHPYHVVGRKKNRMRAIAFRVGFRLALAVSMIFFALSNDTFSQETVPSTSEEFLPETLPDKLYEEDSKPATTASRKEQEEIGRETAPVQNKPEEISRPKKRQKQITDEKTEELSASEKLLDRCFETIKNTTVRIGAIRERMARQKEISELSVRLVKGLVMRWVKKHRPKELEQCETFDHQIDFRKDGMVLLLEGSLRNPDKIVSGLSGLSELLPGIVIERDGLRTLSHCVSEIAKDTELDRDAASLSFEKIDKNIISSLKSQAQCQELGEALARHAARTGAEVSNFSQFWVRSEENEPVLCYKLKGLDDWDIRTEDLEGFTGLALRGTLEQSE